MILSIVTQLKHNKKGFKIDFTNMIEVLKEKMYKTFHDMKRESIEKIELIEKPKVRKIWK